LNFKGLARTLLDLLGKVKGGHWNFFFAPVFMLDEAENSIFGGLRGEDDYGLAAVVGEGFFCSGFTHGHIITRKRATKQELSSCFLTFIC
tara:strand:- start:43 stop:312 length:270 start_codon:yes stop_codon:yes gene_type:complete